MFTGNLTLVFIMPALAHASIDGFDSDFHAARRGDRGAFERLVQATQRMVSTVALAITRDLQSSEDIAQETYLKAWQRLGSMQHPDSFLPWLRHVARNHAIDQVRRRRYQVRPMLDPDDLGSMTDDHDPGPAESLQRAEQHRLLLQALEQIPDQSRDALLLFYREGQSSRQVALLLGISDAAVRKRLQRARSSLDDQLAAALGKTARDSAPGAAFTAGVISTLSAAGAPGITHAASAGSASLASKWLLGAVGSAMAAIAVVMLPVLWEVRRFVRDARSPAERHALRRHGLVYASVMAAYVGMLVWSKHGDWSFGRTLGASAAFAAVIVVLGIRRHRIHRRHRPQD